MHSFDLLFFKIMNHFPNLLWRWPTRFFFFFEIHYELVDLNIFLFQLVSVFLLMFKFSYLWLTGASSSWFLNLFSNLDNFLLSNMTQFSRLIFNIFLQDLKSFFSPKSPGFFRWKILRDCDLGNGVLIMTGLVTGHCVKAYSDSQVRKYIVLKISNNSLFPCQNPHYIKH